MTTLRHGESHDNRTPEYTSWLSMKMRCLQPGHDSYRYYGAKGVTICDRWIASFENFLADMGRKPTPQHSLDRFPNRKGNYEPSNVRWATKSEQIGNRDFPYKKTDKPVFRGDGLAFRSLAEAAASVGVHKTKIWDCCRFGGEVSGFTWEYVDDVFSV